MKHEEKCKSDIKPGYAFLAILGVILLMWILTAVLRIEKYKFFFELFIILFVGTLIYLLNRYTMTVHTYRLEDGVLSVSRGEGVHMKSVAVLDRSMIRLIAPSDYSGDRIPAGDFVKINACSTLHGKSKGWSVWCISGAHDRYRLYFEPSAEMLKKLETEFPNKVIASTDTPNNV